MKEIDALIRKLGTDGFVGAWINAEPAAVCKWRVRNRVPSWWIPKLAAFAQEQGQTHATPEWLMSVNLKTAMKRKR